MYIYYSFCLFFTLLTTQIFAISNNYYYQQSYSTFSKRQVRSDSKTNQVTCDKFPEDDKTSIDAIRDSGYPAEEHFVKSQDGYILALHRIPGPQGSQAVLLHHGLFDSSFGWILNGKNKALAYQLADNGYDVWLGNARGNTYSRRHVRLSPNDSNFWDFSWHEMGVYDLPAEIDYITSLKNDSLFYVGHSMGTTMFFVMASERPEMSSKIKLMIALAPSTYLDNIQGGTLTAMPFARLAQPIIHKINFGVTVPIQILHLLRCFCSQSQYKILCRDIMFLYSGSNPDHFDMSIVRLIGRHYPAGNSIKAVMHYWQVYNAGKFIKFDYNKEKNLKVYRNATPPEYDLTKIKVPVAIFYGRNDYLTTPTDVLRLWKKLPVKAGLFEIEDRHFNHLDFITADNAAELVNSKIMLLLNKY